MAELWGPSCILFDHVCWGGHVGSRGLQGEETEAQQEQMTFASLSFNQFGGFPP